MDLKNRIIELLDNIKDERALRLIYELLIRLNKS